MVYYSWMTFDPSSALHSGPELFVPNLVPYRNTKQFDLFLTPDDPCMAFDPCNALHSGQGFLLPNLVVLEHL